MRFFRQPPPPPPAPGPAKHASDMEVQHRVKSNSYDRIIQRPDGCIIQERGFECEEEKRLSMGFSDTQAALPGMDRFTQVALPGFANPGASVDTNRLYRISESIVSPNPIQALARKA